MKTDILILGGGMVGLCLARQILNRGTTKNISIIDKEEILGAHSSGRNSGVLHAGLYYKPNSLKAKVCVEGAKRLRSWIEKRGLPINPCGKVIVPQKLDLDPQLDVLAQRGRANGAVVEYLDAEQLKELAPEARSSSGRALWSPNTAVVNPKEVLKQLQADLTSRGVQFIMSTKDWDPRVEENCLKLSNGASIHYGHLFNCTGLQADRIAHQFGVGLNYSLLPFKGLYWQLKDGCPIQIKTNIYPVPDLNIPFLGVHFTPSADANPVISIGPTATLAMGRENYRGMEGIEPMMAASNLKILAQQYIDDQGGFRRYVHEQAFLSLSPLLLRAAQELIPDVKAEYLEISKKVGIRAQLFNKESKTLEDDFLCLHGLNSTHVLNVISPAFTASFALADLILDQATPRLNLA